MIRRLAVIAATVVAATGLDAQHPFDRDHPPALGPAPELPLPAVHRARLDNGAGLVVVEQRELPLVHVTVDIAGGGRLDNQTAGLATFVASLLREGAGSRDANALQAELAFLGASLSTGADWDNSSVTLRVAKRNLVPALDLFADVVLRPRFAAEDVNRQRDLRLAGLTQQRDQPTALATLAFDQSLFPAGHPYRRSLGGDSSSTVRLDSAMVRAFYDGSYRPRRATFTVVGDVGTDEIRDLLSARFDDWSVRGEERRPAPVLVAPTRSEARRIILVDKPGAAQSVIRIGTPGIERTTPDYAAIQVMNTILGGSFSSRLNSNLRETKGYTYGAGSGFAWRPLPGAWVASASVRTDVTDSSLVEFFKEFAAIRNTPVEEAELERAKAYLALGVPGDLETNSQIASEIGALAAFNLPLSWLQEYVAAVGRVTAEDVQRVARRLIPESTATIIVVGDLAQIRAPIEALNLGTVVEMTVAELMR